MRDSPRLLPVVVMPLNRLDYNADLVVVEGRSLENLLVLSSFDVDRGKVNSLASAFSTLFNRAVSERWTLPAVRGGPVKQCKCNTTNHRTSQIRFRTVCTRKACASLILARNAP
jgi:hypothetical protein